MPAVRWFETMLATWISGSEPTCQPAVHNEETHTFTVFSSHLCQRVPRLLAGSAARLQGSLWDQVCDKLPDSNWGHRNRE